VISRLPRWVEYGSFILALVAGFVNAIGLLGFNHQSISHLSGTTTLIATGIVNVDFSAIFHLLMVLFSFIAGAAVSGFYLRSGALKLGRNYSRLLSVESLLLLISIYFLTEDIFFGHYLASAACGLQNALVTTYSGAVVRTTHMTGIFTDLGIMLGAKLRGEFVDKRKVSLFLLIIFGFIAGGTLGAYFFLLWQFKALFIPSATCLLLAISYSVYLSRIEARQYPI